MDKIVNSHALGEFSERLCSKQLGADLGKVGTKFVHNMLEGIHRTRSVNLTEIAKGLSENIRLHATHKRLSRNLDNPLLAKRLSERLLKLGAATVKDDTRLFVHTYELNKKYARKVEYLPDPNTDSNMGFKVCEIIASNPESDTYTPLLARVWSDRVPGYVSDVEEVRRALLLVMRATGNKGMLHFDDQSLSGDSLRPIMDEPGIKFLVMMGESKLDVSFRNEVCSLQSLAEQTETPYGRTMFKLVPGGAGGISQTTDLDLFVHAGAMSVKFPDSDRNLGMIALKTKNRFVGEIVTPMITSETNLRSRKALMGLVESFFTLQDVLSTHQTLREEFDPASFRVLTYNRLQLLMTLLQAVMHYEVSSLGNVSVDHHRFSVKPHSGDVNRTYLMPGQLQAQ